VLQHPAAVHCGVCRASSVCVCVCKRYSYICECMRVGMSDQESVCVSVYSSSRVSEMSGCTFKCYWLQLNKTCRCMCETVPDWACVGVKPLCISFLLSYNMFSQNYLFF